MKNSSQFISESVFRANIKYSELQNETKELFFKCLYEGRDLDYFKAKLEQLWGNIDRSILQQELDEYEAMIHEYNVNDREIIKEEDNGSMIFALIPISEALKQEKRFVKLKIKEYEDTLNSKGYQNNKQEYLKLKVKKYNNQIVPYYVYDKNTGELNYIRYVQLSTYEAMIHNTNLVRTGWNTTINDADSVGISKFWIPYHSFSCEHCLAHQNRILTKEEVIDLIGMAEEQDGDILHPNCKCQIVMYDFGTRFNRPKYSNMELKEQYTIRQKVNTLTLAKDRLRTDMKIQQMLGNIAEVDKLNQKRNKINSEIRDLKEALPTDSLKKQVVAINR